MRPLFAIVITTVILYFAKDILLPLAGAFMLALVFSPIMERLERFVGRLISAACRAVRNPRE